MAREDLKEALSETKQPANQIVLNTATTLNLIKSSPALQAQKALIILDVQNDSLDDDNGTHLTKNADLIPRLKESTSILRPNMRIFWTCKGIQEGESYKGSAEESNIHRELLDVFDGKKDRIMVKNYDSAFKETALLMDLRKEMITEVYLSGRWSNAAIWSTAIDATQHGIHLYLIEDCFGYREEDQHQEAMNQMIDKIGVDVVTSEQIKDSHLEKEWADVGQCFEKLYLNTDEDTIVISSSGNGNPSSISHGWEMS